MSDHFIVSVPSYMELDAESIRTVLMINFDISPDMVAVRKMESEGVYGPAPEEELDW